MTAIFSLATRCSLNIVFFSENFKIFRTLAFNEHPVPLNLCEIFVNSVKIDRSLALLLCEKVTLGAAYKKVVLLGGAHNKVAYPPPPPRVVVKVPLFCGKVFVCLESPETEK